MPKLHVVEADPGGGRGGASWPRPLGGRLFSLVAVDPPDGLWLDIAGLAHLFGDEAGLCATSSPRLGRQGIAARAAVADAPGTAWAVARFGTIGSSPPGRAVEAVASLPVAALRLPAALVETLHTLGVDRVGQLAAMPRAPMVRRFGADTALRLDRALGQAFEPIDPLMPDIPRAASPSRSRSDGSRICKGWCGASPSGSAATSPGGPRACAGSI